MLHPLVPPVLDWFTTHARDLPWRRRECTAWGVLVSEVMLQQTPVVRVRPAWEEWMDRWPTPADLAGASTADVLRAWDRLGYPRRALRLQQCARHLVDHHDGVMPRTEPELLALPGVGSYTAAAVMAFAHGRRSVVLDTNVRRVLARVLDGHALPDPTLTRGEHARAAQVVPPDDATAAAWSAAVMELGALLCTARAPRCEECPLADRCAWVAAGRPVDVHAHRRRRQAWAGTDRQARGRVMRALRTSDHPVPRAVLATDVTDPVQLTRVLDGLLTDGLVTCDPVDDADDAVYRLPA